MTVNCSCLVRVLLLVVCVLMTAVDAKPSSEKSALRDVSLNGIRIGMSQSQASKQLGIDLSDLHAVASNQAGPVVTFDSSSKQVTAIRKATILKYKGKEVIAGSQPSLLESILGPPQRVKSEHLTWSNNELNMDVFLTPTGRIQLFNLALLSKQ